MLKFSKVLSPYNFRCRLLCVRTMKSLPRTQDGKLVQNKEYKMVQYQHTLLLEEGHDVPEHLSEEMMEELILTKNKIQRYMILVQ